MAFPAIPKVAKGIMGMASAAQSKQGDQGEQGNKNKKPANPIQQAGEAFSEIRKNNPNMGLFSDSRLKIGMTIGRYAEKGRDGREYVNLGAYGDGRK